MLILCSLPTYQEGWGLLSELCNCLGQKPSLGLSIAIQEILWKQALSGLVLLEWFKRLCIHGSSSQLSH